MTCPPPPHRRRPCARGCPHRRRRPVRPVGDVPVLRPAASPPPHLAPQVRPRTGRGTSTRRRIRDVDDAALHRCTRRCPAEGWSASLVGSAKGASTALGFRAIRRGDIVAHRAWMIRAYALAVAAGTQPLTRGSSVARTLAGPDASAPAQPRLGRDDPATRHPLRTPAPGPPRRALVGLVGGPTITREDVGATTLRGTITEQAELHGLLSKVRDLGIPNCRSAPAEPPTRTAAGPGSPRLRCACGASASRSLSGPPSARKWKPSCSGCGGRGFPW